MQLDSLTKFILNQNENSKIIIHGELKKSLLLVKNGLRDRENISSFQIDGQTTKDQRQLIMDEFEKSNTIRVLL